MPRQIFSVIVSEKKEYYNLGYSTKLVQTSSSPQNVSHVIVVCCVLHNIATWAGLGLSVEDDLDVASPVARPPQHVMAAVDVLMGVDHQHQDGPDGQAAGRAIIHHRFT